MDIPISVPMREVIRRCGVKLDMLDPKRAFFSNGMDIPDIKMIDDDEIIYISRGEGFRAPTLSADGTERIGDYSVLGALGKGGFGTVVKAKHVVTGGIYAIKMVSKSSFQNVVDLQRVFNEIQTLRDLKHVNVIQISDVLDHPTSVCFVMEFAKSGELRSVVEKSEGGLSEAECKMYMKQIVRAVHYCHSRNVIHRDIKLENILLSDQVVKVADFGLADFVVGSKSVVTDAGTVAYLAPEVLANQSLASDPFKLDIWALGVLLYAMSHRHLPFPAAEGEHLDKLAKSGLQFKAGLSDKFKDFVKKLLTIDWRARPDINQIKADPWVDMGGSRLDADSPPRKSVSPLK